MCKTWKIVFGRIGARDSNLPPEDELVAEEGRDGEDRQDEGKRQMNHNPREQDPLELSL
jgi:hypothetical protein